MLATDSTYTIDKLSILKDRSIVSISNSIVISDRVKAKKVVTFVNIDSFTLSIPMVHLHQMLLEIAILSIFCHPVLFIVLLQV